MMIEDLRKLKADELRKRTHELVAEERKLNLEILKLLNEVERRRLHVLWGYRNLFDFCTRELKYSESAAWRRISAMRLLNEIPQAEEKIASGKLSISSAKTIQNFLYAESKIRKKTYTSSEKMRILESVENKSARETERTLASISPQAIPVERERALNDQEIEIRFVADGALTKKLDRLKDLNSHRDPERSYRGLFHWLSDLGLKQVDPLQKTTSARPASLRSADPTRYIPLSLRRQVWERDGSQCTYRDPKTRIRCQARSRLEIDHIVPYSLGGKTELENLRLYCKTHNQQAAIATFGDAKIRASAKRESPLPAANDPAIA